MPTEEFIGMPNLLTSENLLSTNLTVQQPTSRSVAEAILEQLRLWRVERIYGVTGDAIFGLMDAIAKQKTIQFIAVKHESVAAMMASAEAKCTGNLGVCVAQMGPGLANLINGLGDAFLDGFPVLAITGQAPLNKIGTSYKQYINQQELVQAITGYSQLVVHPDAVIDSLVQAIHTSVVTGTASHLSIPADVFNMQTIIQPYEPIQATEVVSNPGMLQQALQFMRSAQRPMMLLGKEAKLAGAEIRQLADIWGSGVAMGYGEIGIIPDTFPYGLGGLGEGGNPHLTSLFNQADIVLAIGTSGWPEGHSPTDTRVVQIVSRQMRLEAGFPVDCGIVGNLMAVIPQLIEGLKPNGINQNWLHQIRKCKETWSNQNEKEGNEAGFPLHPSRIVRAIERYTSPDAVIALDEGDSTLWFMRNFRAQNQQVLLSSRWRTMGFGLPASMAAKLCMPHKQVLCITGDGGLAMVLADLLTAARYRLQITVIVMNNGTLQMERNKMASKGLIPEGTDITNPDYVKLAEACGWNACRIQSADELEHLLKKSQTNQKPMLLDVCTAQVPYPSYQS
jgi:pyruvate oxidase